MERLRDRNQSAAYVWVLITAFAVTQVGNLFGYFDNSAPMSWIKLVVIIVVGAIVFGLSRRARVSARDLWAEPLRPRSSDRPRLNLHSKAR
jgi:hypothetical protein